MLQQWWRDAVIYQIYVRSFRDSNGDGIGDLPGVRSALPYLADLGVDGIWLNPFYPSPQHDHGYDVADYCGVEPAYGTLDDFDALVADAHALGIRVIIDIVPNHCSIAHPLFQQALTDGPGSPARDRFHFADGRNGGTEPPNNWRSMFGGPVWQQVDDGQWYLHMFTPEQPDLNWRHPGTATMFEGVLRFWLDRGVDGFRIDAAHGLFKHPDLPDTDDPYEEERVGDAANPLAWNRPEVHDVYRSWRALCDTYTERDGVDRVLVGEITGMSRPSLPDYVRPGEMHQGFFFDLLDAPYDGAAFARLIQAGLHTAEASGTTVTWALGNHDNTRIVTRYGSADRARAAMLLALALPGSAYLYQGDELDLPEVTDLPDDRRTDPIFYRTGGVRLGRDGCRIPLPWSGNAAPFGFSTTADTWLPQPPSFAAHTVETLRDDPASGWHLYQKALRLRRKHLLGEQPVQWLPSPAGVIAFTRGDGFTCVANLTDAPVPAPLPSVPHLSSGATAAGTVPASTTAWWLP
ncbi:glycoside hydrolase family 13 protein [Actinoplanes sp. CA-131856]